MCFEVVFQVKYPQGEAYEMCVLVDDVTTKQAAIAAAKKQMKRNFGDAEINKYLRCEQKQG